MIGFTTVTFRAKTAEEVCQIAAANGIKCIEWGGDKHLPYDDEQALSEVKRLTGEHGIQNLSYGSYYRVGEDDMPKFEKICRVASEIGAKVVRIWLGNKGSLFTSKQQFRIMVGEVQRMCEIAGKYGLTVASEFHQRTYNDCGKSSLRFIKAVGKANYKTYWQPLSRGKSDLKNLRMVLDYVAIAHVFNWKNFDIRYEFDYEIERWQQFFELLIRKDVPLIMEFVKNDDEQIFAKDLMTIKNVVGENE